MTKEIILPGALEVAHWQPLWTCEKFDADLEEFLTKFGPVAGPLEFRQRHDPYERVVVPGNVLVNVGIQVMLDALIGTGITAYSNANARIGVGDSNTAAAATQIDLQAATNKLRKAMDATFPSRTAQTMSFKSSFTSAEANYAWLEWAIFNGATANVGMLNRKQESLGTKTTGTWTLQADLTIA